MTDPNLTAALRGSLRLVEDNVEETSPLSEATPDSVDIFLDRINQHLVEGVPEAITDDLLMQTVEAYRAQAYQWSQEEQKKRDAPRRTRKKVESGEFDPDFVVDIDLLS